MHQYPQVSAPSLVPYRPLSARELARILPQLMAEAITAIEATGTGWPPSEPPKMVAPLTIESVRARIQARLHV